MIRTTNTGEAPDIREEASGLAKNPSKTPRGVYVLLALVILAGLTLRTWNVRFDSGLGSHPDERSTTCFYAPSIKWPASWDELKDPHRSPLNPLWDREHNQRRSYTYGHFPLYLGILTGEALHRLAPVADALGLPEQRVQMMRAANTACDGVAVAGRLLIALLDTLTILLLFFLGRRLYGSGAGLLAASFYAFTAQAIQLSHFFAMDPASTTFTVLAVLGGVRMVQERTWRGVILAGVGAGLAISSKFSALPILAAPVVAALVVAWQSTRPQTGVDSRAALRMIWGAVVALLLAAATFALTSPYAVLDWQSFIQATLVEQGQMVRGIADFPFTRQYRNTTPYLYFIQQQVAWGMWWPLGLVTLGGTLWALVKVFLGRASGGELVVWSWLVPYFGLTGAFLAKFNRYMSPVLPFAVLFAAGFITWLWRGENRYRVLGIGDAPRSTQGSNSQYPISTRLGSRALAALLAAIALAGAVFWSVAYVNGVYNTEHTWVTASRWVYEHAPRGSVILWELWDDPLPKALPDEPGMDMGSKGLRHIDWSPYEEDTPEKYEILKQKLREADYVIYSSKRIYDSVDELPERYPMTTRYYDLMFAEKLGFRLVQHVTTPPKLFGLTFPDHTADESWSLYDHPQVSIFQKERDLTDAEFDALLGGSWEGAIPWYRGKDSPLSPLLEALGLGSSPESQHRGLINGLLALLRGEERPPAPQPLPEDRKSLNLDVPLHRLPVVDNYRWNVAASESPWLGVAWWWLVVSLLGWAAWPLAFLLFGRLRDGGFLLSKTFGWLLSAWLLWMLASYGLAHNTVVNSWLAAGVIAVLGGIAGVWKRRELAAFLGRSWPALLVGEGLFAAAYVLFVLVRMGNPDIWQPWFGGEKYMEFAFLNGILRSPTFPPVDPHFAGGYINYYYFGIYLVAYLIKLTGIYAEVAFNLAVPTLFALTVVNAFAVAYAATARRRSDEATVGRGDEATVGRGDEATERRGDEATELGGAVAEWRGDESSSRRVVESSSRRIVESSSHPISQPAPDILDLDVSALHPPVIQSTGQPANRPTDQPISNLQSPIPDIQSPIPNPQSSIFNLDSSVPHTPWHAGLAWALLAPLFVAVIGNLDSFAQIVRKLVELSPSQFQSAIPAVQTAVRAASGFWHVLTTDAQLPGYDFWAPSRVIPYTINEFPFWSFTFADLHPHMIGIPFSVLFLGLVLAILHSYNVDWRKQLGQAVVTLAGFGLLLGTLASVNLWELPTYYGLGVLAVAVSLHRGRGRLDWPLLLGFAVFYLAAAYGLFWPFFDNYVNVGASGVGLVPEPDHLGTWLLIWGFFAFILVSWLLVTVALPARPGDARPTGLERWLSLAARRFDQLPRLLHLQGVLVKRPTLAFLAAQALFPLVLLAALLLGLFTEQKILALCLPFLALAFLLLWRRGRAADPGALLVALLTATGFAILAGTQVVYLKDFLQGGDWRRMNTLFKFFIQVWVLWGVAAAVAVPRILGAGQRLRTAREQDRQRAPRNVLRPAWTAAFALLLAASFAYPLWGLPARLDQRFPGWRPPFGTLNGLDFMREGVYFWPDGNNPIELAYDWEAIQWLLNNTEGNLVIAESATLEYYRAGGSRVASTTGLSGLTGMHEGEQRYGDEVGQRSALLSEFWNTPDPARMEQLIRELGIDLIYVGQLERHEHPAAVERLRTLAERGVLVQVYSNPKVIIYGVPDRLILTEDGALAPAPG